VKEEKKRNREIEKMLQDERKQMESTIKLLLLGAGECGKSTIAKQMKILHCQGFTEEDKNRFKTVVTQNVVTSMQILIKAASKMNIQISENNQTCANSLCDINPMDCTRLTEKIGTDIKELWKDNGIQKTFERRNEYQLQDSVDYFCNNIDRLCDPKYVPTEQDILRARVKTTGVHETNFEVEKTRFKLVDVGGQRNERRKWIHCFSDVTAVLFVCSLSEYDQKLGEDENVNRMQESLKLFEDICNNEFFTSTPMILFLNKRDLFAEKIKKVPLTVCFPDYQGGSDYDKATKYISDKFMEKNRNSKRQIYPHLTCATDTGNIKIVWKFCRDIVLRIALEIIGVADL